MTQYAIETHHLRKIYRSRLRKQVVVAVDSLDLKVPQGCVFGFLGPNGAGKTTTIMMLLGNVYPTSGSFRIFGSPISNMGVRRRIGDLTRRATVSAEVGRAEFLRDGLDRDWDDGPRAWEVPPGTSATYAWDAPVALRELRLVFDSDLSRPHTSGFMPCCYPLGKGPYLAPPKPLVKRFRVEVRDAAGAWSLLVEDDNHQRHRRLPVGRSVTAVRLTPLATWGGGPARVFAMDVRS